VIELISADDVRRKCEKCLTIQKGNAVPDERTTLKNAIDKYLKTLAPHVWFRKQWGGGIYQHSGDSDYTICAWGRFGVIESKHPIDKPPLEEAQKLFQEKITRAGGFVIQATCVSDVIVSLENIRAGRGWDGRCGR
jgi:hypothetical protein